MKRKRSGSDSGCSDDSLDFSLRKGHDAELLKLEMRQLNAEIAGMIQEKEKSSPSLIKSPKGSQQGSQNSQSSMIKKNLVATKKSENLKETVEMDKIT